jgi:hypothetical protein
MLVYLTCFSLHAAPVVDCPDFETTLQYLVKNVKENKGSPTTPMNRPSVLQFKAKNEVEFALKKDANRDFMLLMEADAKRSPKNVVYFDVENSIQKKLNDQIFGEKTMVDAVNNSFLKRFYTAIENNPELKSRLSGTYKDYKSLRLRLELRPGDNKEKFQAMLGDAYKKSSQEFASEFKSLGIDDLIKTRTDDVANPERWFLAGVGDDALEANMAARGARTISATEAQKIRPLNYRDHVASLSKDVNEIESLRMQFSKFKAMPFVDQLENGALIPSKEMINILRKYKPGDFKNDAEYFAQIANKVKSVFGKEIDYESIALFTKYQQKVDSISPPLFSRERTIINLEEANNGIVSIDFAGVGVDNLHQQMQALAKVNYREVDQTVMLKSAFNQLQSHVDQVTTDMNMAKRAFTSAVQNQNGKVARPLFSGDDGIYMPGKDWNIENKQKLVKQLSESSDPSKFRVTFVKSKYPDGANIPVETRSKLIVKAETLEKKLREEMVSVNGLSYSDAKKIITAIDFTPFKKGGEFNLIIAGKKLTPSEENLITTIVKKLVKTDEGESFGKIIYP